MLLSMTGFGQGTAHSSEFDVRVEIRSVNHKYRDISIRTPPGYPGLEDPIRKAIADRIRRGRIDVYVAVQRLGSPESRIRVNSSALADYARAISDALIDAGLKAEPGPEFILNLPGVLVFEEERIETERVWPTVSAALDEAVGELLRMRKIEGSRLAEDLKSGLAVIRVQAGRVSELAPGVVESYSVRLRKRIEELCAGTDVPEERIAYEVGLFADRCDIHEEITRLNSHMDQFEATIQLDEPVGRRLEFLIQEMFREASTMASKANDASISAISVAIRNLLEQMREQVQNIE